MAAGAVTGEKRKVRPVCLLILDLTFFFFFSTTFIPCGGCGVMMARLGASIKVRPADAYIFVCPISCFSLSHDTRARCALDHHVVVFFESGSGFWGDFPWLSFPIPLPLKFSLFSVFEKARKPRIVTCCRAFLIFHDSIRFSLLEDARRSPACRIASLMGKAKLVACNNNGRPA